MTARTRARRPAKGCKHSSAFVGFDEKPVSRHRTSSGLQACDQPLDHADKRVGPALVSERAKTITPPSLRPVDA